MDLIFRTEAEILTLLAQCANYLNYLPVIRVFQEQFSSFEKYTNIIVYYKLYLINEFSYVDFLYMGFVLPLTQRF